jgi:hypothetical protein
MSPSRRPQTPFALPRFICRNLALVLLAGGVLSLAACASGRKFVKAKPAERTVTLEQRKDLVADPPGSGPFHLVRRSTSPSVLKAAREKKGLTVLPVDLSHLKPGGRLRGSIPSETYAQSPAVQEMAAYLRYRFHQEANRSAASGRRKPLTLQLALTEFVPTSAAGNVARTAAGFFVGPATILASPLTKGTIAIEGTVRDPATGRIVLQFADRESDPITWISVRDYQPTAYAKVIADQWAQQLPQVLRSPAGTTVKDAPFFRLNPF